MDAITKIIKTSFIVSLYVTTSCSVRKAMKVLPLLLFLVYMHDAVGDEMSFEHKGFPKLYPNKSARKNMKILVSRRYLNQNQNTKYQNPEILMSRRYWNQNPNTKYQNPKYQYPQPQPAQLVREKLPSPLNGYTVFPNLGQPNQFPEIPDSPYFQIANLDVQRPRVKNAISDYAIIAVRKKRDTMKQQQSLKGQVNNKMSEKRDTMLDAKPIPHLSAKPMKQGKEGVKKSMKSNLKESRAKLRSNNMKSNKTRKAKRNKKQMRSNSTKKAKKLRMGRSHRNTTKVTPVRPKANDSRRLIAARDAMIEDYPYVVSIQKNGEHWCAGALLNPRVVVTTANCMWKSNRMSRLKVRVGSRHADRGGYLVEIKEVMKHPAWSIRKSPDNDVALLYLDRRIKFSHKLHGVDLPNRIMVPPFEDAWITSWGAERRDGVFDKKAMTLQVYHSRLMDRKKCNNITQRFGVIVTENFICLSQSGRTAPCTRDTGAPAVSDGVLWGLASWGIRRLCGTERFPAMFSYLGSHSNMDFIANATRFLMSDERLNPYLDRYPKVKQYEVEPTTSDPLYGD